MTEEHKNKIRQGQMGHSRGGWKWSKKERPKRTAWNKGLKGYMAGENHHWFGRNMKGENSPVYIPDRTLLKTDRRHAYDYKYRTWSKDVKNRDGWKCKISNGDCSGRLEAHHILGWKDYPELRYEINNGITLCHAHHPRKRAEEKRLEPFFMELVSVSK